jgi:hypothetical protein
LLCTRDGWRRRKIVAARERRREHKRVCERKKRKAFTALQLGKPFDAGFFIIYAFSDLYSDLFPFNRDFSILMITGICFHRLRENENVGRAMCERKRLFCCDYEIRNLL